MTGSGQSWTPLRRFRDRREAGRRLAEELERYSGRDDVIVLGLPRGGIPVGFEVAAALGAPFDAMLVRKLGVPRHEELAMGAIASGDVRVVNEDVVRALELDEQTIAAAAARERRELERRELLYRRGAPAPDVDGRVAILVDDGLATGATMRAAAAALRARGPQRVVAAVPVASPEACAELEADADEVVCAVKPEAFGAVGAWYDRFEPPSDEEIVDLLARGRGRGREAHLSSAGHG
jgi:putative phosphoribosyl transferase